MVHPDILKQSVGGHGGMNSGTEQLSVEPLDVQAVKCAEMPCTLAAQGGGDANTEQVPNDVSLSLSNFMTTHRPNTGETSLIDVNLPVRCSYCL